MQPQSYRNNHWTCLTYELSFQSFNWDENVERWELRSHFWCNEWFESWHQGDKNGTEFPEKQVHPHPSDMVYVHQVLRIGKIRGDRKPQDSRRITYGGRRDKKEDTVCKRCGPKALESAYDPSVSESSLSLLWRSWSAYRIAQIKSDSPEVKWIPAQFVLLVAISQGFVAVLRYNGRFIQCISWPSPVLSHTPIPHCSWVDHSIITKIWNFLPQDT